MIESSRSEKRLGGKYIAFKSAAETTRNSIIKEENLKLEEKRRREKIAEFGSGKNTIDGTIDRVNKLPYDPNKFPKKEDQQSYYYGYYYRGSRV